MAGPEIPFTRYIDAEGRAVAALPNSVGTQVLTRLYREMVMARRFDAKMISLQRTGRIPTYPPTLGQEAFHIGLAHAMAEDDALFPTYRDMPSQLARGITLAEALLILSGDERGNDFAGPRADFPQAIPIATQVTHAVGAAYAMKLRGERRAALATIGDGGTSKGDFYEAMNFAGVWQVPVVFAINNNGWAISMPRDRQSAAGTLAQKSIAAGIPGEQADGNDAVAVYDVIGRALARARDGGGPSVVECLTHRLTDHSTADDASRYRDAGPLSEQWKEEPVQRLRTYLSEEGLWSKEDEEQLIAEIDSRLEETVDGHAASTPPPPEAMFDHLYAEVPADLAGQRRQVMARFAGETGEGDGHG